MSVNVIFDLKIWGLSSVQGGEEIGEEFADPDRDQLFEEKPAPQPVEEHREFVCLVCGAAFATHNRLTTPNFVRELSTGDLIPERHISTYIEMDMNSA